MRRHRLRPGDDAVSPVIGVVILIAIAVTLMGTIGVFVLGFGPGEQAPNGDIVFSQVETGTGTHVNVTVAWAEGLNADQVTIRVDDEDACYLDDRNDWSGSLDEGEEVTVTGPSPSSCSGLDPNQTIRVIWSPQGGSRTEVIERFEVI